MTLLIRLGYGFLLRWALAVLWIADFELRVGIGAGLVLEKLRPTGGAALSCVQKKDAGKGAWSHKVS